MTGALFTDMHLFWSQQLIKYPVWDEINYTFPNFNGTKVEGLKKFHVTLYNGCNYKSDAVLVKYAPNSCNIAFFLPTTRIYSRKIYKDTY